MNTSTPTTAAPRRQRRKHERPDEIVAAALALFSERGFSATRLEDVATRAGVAKGTLYLYFPSKEALLEAVVHRYVVPKLAQGEKLLQDYHGDTKSLLRELLGAWWADVDDSPESSVPKLMVAEAGNFPELTQFFVQAVVLRGRQLFRQIIRRGIERGELRNCNVDHVSRLLIAPIIYSAIWLKSFRQFDEAIDFQAFAESHIELVLNGLTVR